MIVEYVGKHFHPGDQIKAYAEDKLSKVLPFVEEPIEVRITLEAEKARHVADVHLSHRHGVLQATEETENMVDAINAAVDKVAKQARRSRKKFIDQRRRKDRGSAEDNRWPVDVIEAASLDAGGGIKVVKSTHLPIKPMSVDEAALTLQSSRSEFIVFRDAATEEVSVLYRRKDQNYGLIVPES